MNPILELYAMGQQIPLEVLTDVDKRIGDWLLSGGDINHPYVWQQVDYARKFVGREPNGQR